MQESLISTKTKIALLFTATTTVMSGITVVASLPLMAQTFSHIPDIAFLSKLMLTIPSIIIALLAPFIGVLTDRIGRLKPLYIGLLLFVIGGSSGFYLHDFTYILIGRAILGVGVAMIMTSSTALVGDYFDEASRHKFLSMQGVAVGLGGILFITGGGYLAELHWSYPFAIYLIPLLFFPLIFAALFEPEHHKKAVQQQEFDAPRLWPVFGTAFFAMVLFYMLPTQLPYLIVQTLQGSPSDVGVLIAFSMLVNALTSMNYSKIKARLSFGSIFMVTFLFFAAGLMIISQAANLSQLYFSTFFMGVGFGLMLVNINAWFLSRVPPAIKGKASGILASSFFMGQFASPLLFEPVVKLLGIQGLFFNVALFSLALSFVIFISKKRGRPNRR